ncbi:AfsR/SARP family transcriptional regulator [Streptomyces triticirhizae]|uniref:Activator protein n=1 Tax=Streptomyces triticirhizae TaxID=2483353 RepID=A0A3M2M1F8_9ACTN|nr:AfsR/SARP family transcriptional regulator [Streptomyces triticirhizae]RMI43366.1 activator protein [Streptomyces triticirhizae]
MKYEVLGPLRVTGAGGTSFISPRKAETLLAVLLTRADQVVSTDQLLSEIWAMAAPRRANAALHVYVSQLRKILRGPAGSGTSPIVTRPRGYLLRTGRSRIDAVEFQQLAQQGRAHVREGRYEEAAAAFEAGLKLWTGSAFNGLTDSPLVYGYAIWLEESRLECLEMLMETYLMLGRHREIVGRLRKLSAEHPMRESFYRLRMIALYRCERQVEALEVYRAARKRLTDEVGLEPCQSLQEVHNAILLGEDPSPTRMRTLAETGPAAAHSA